MHVTELANAKVYRNIISDNLIIAALVLTDGRGITLVTHYGDYQYDPLRAACIATKRKQFPIALPVVDWGSPTDDQKEIDAIVGQRWDAQLSLAMSRPY